MPAVAASGEQFEISFGEHRATVVEVGGGVREYNVGDRAVLDPYPVDQMCDGAHGAPLIPWPNRLADGRYRFEGVDYQVAITEPEKSTAIHGFLRWRNWRLLERGPSQVVVGTVLHPLAGYPFTLDVTVRYQLDADGLTVTTQAENIGNKAAPWACGAHPYLSAGGAPLDDCLLEFVAARRIDTDSRRQLPTAVVDNHGTPFDFRQPHRIGNLAIDYAFRDVARDASGHAWVALTAPDGRTARIWVDETYPIVEIYTGDTLAPHRRRRGLGVEPMTAPPDAFGTGDGVRTLRPGDSVVHTWGASLLR